MKSNPTVHVFIRGIIFQNVFFYFLSNQIFRSDSFISLILFPLVKVTFAQGFKGEGVSIFCRIPWFSLKQFLRADTVVSSRFVLVIRRREILLAEIKSNYPLAIQLAEDFTQIMRFWNTTHTFLCYEVRGGFKYRAQEKNIHFNLNIRLSRNIIPNYETK